jgi:Na+(H+)/acetate symporter ActP
VQAITTLLPTPAFLLQTRLLTLSGVDFAIIALNFVAVLGIGFYRKRLTRSALLIIMGGIYTLKFLPRKGK